jgi:hypothetical protein
MILQLKVLVLSTALQTLTHSKKLISSNHLRGGLIKSPPPNKIFQSNFNLLCIIAYGFKARINFYTAGFSYDNL